MPLQQLLLWEQRKGAKNREHQKRCCAEYDWAHPVVYLQCCRVFSRIQRIVAQRIPASLQSMVESARLYLLRCMQQPKHNTIWRTPYFQKASRPDYIQEGVEATREGWTHKWDSITLCARSPKCHSWYELIINAITCWSYCFMTGDPFLRSSCSLLCWSSLPASRVWIFLLRAKGLGAEELDGGSDGGSGVSCANEKRESLFFSAAQSAWRRARSSL